MATTAKDIIEASYARSTANDPTVLATDAELVGVIDRRLKQLYSLSARINPYRFAKTATASHDGTGWPLPADAEAVFFVEDSGSNEVHIMSFKDKEGERAPRVYKFGNRLITVGKTGDPINTDDLTLSYSYLHGSLDPTVATDAAGNTLDTEWPEQFNDLLVINVAKYLALKDQNRPDTAPLSSEEAQLVELFIQHLKNYNVGVGGRFAQNAGLIDPTHGSIQTGSQG